MSADHGDPHKPGGMSATLKQEGKDRPWLVFHGSPASVARDIKATFPELAESDESLADLVNEAQRLFSAVGNAHRTLGARPAGNNKNGSAWAEARGDSAPAEQKPEPTLAEIIEALESVEEAKELWLDRSDEIKSASLVEAWTAKAKALKPAA